MPLSGLVRDGVISITSLTTCSSSPGRVGLGKAISAPAPTMPPAMGRPPVTSSRIVSAAVCQPLAASPANSELAAASSSR
jgi:hypothetical protein